MARKKNVKIADTQLTKPQTRLERYLGTIAGLFSDAPTDPRTRLERYLAAIIESGGGGGGGGGTNPTGTVIYFAGTTAPDGYLACDGTAYNIADYPELAQFFADNYGSANYWGGDGTTTFAVPDWRGEFFRGSGQNSHANQGSGAAVGAHQDATRFPRVAIDIGGNVFSQSYSPSRNASPRDPDNNIALGDEIAKQTVSTKIGQYDGGISTSQFTSRPTNTSLLVCIKE